MLKSDLRPGMVVYVQDAWQHKEPTVAPVRILTRYTNFVAVQRLDTAGSTYRAHYRYWELSADGATFEPRPPTTQRRRVAQVV